MSEISIETLQSWRSKKRAMQIVDIREIQEFQLGNLGGDHIPMAECLRRHREIRRDIPVVVHCRTGRRSEAVVSALVEKHGFENGHGYRRLGARCFGRNHRIFNRDLRGTLGVVGRASLVAGGSGEAGWNRRSVEGREL